MNDRPAYYNLGKIQAGVPFAGRDVFHAQPRVNLTRLSAVGEGGARGRLLMGKAGCVVKHRRAGYAPVGTLSYNATGKERSRSYSSLRVELE